jgi:2-methylisocitrate lyase-like PEP mutase family enzyme
MERTTTTLRRLIERPGLIVAPVCFDPLTARTAAELGFECVALGGYALGSHLAASEPLLTMTEVVEAARRITSSVQARQRVASGRCRGRP